MLCYVMSHRIPVHTCICPPVPGLPHLRGRFQRQIAFPVFLHATERMASDIHLSRRIQTFKRTIPISFIASAQSLNTECDMDLSDLHSSADPLEKGDRRR